MSVQSIGVDNLKTAFNDRIFEVMDHIEYRRIVTQEDFESIGELRSRAFDAHTVYSRKLNGNAVDESDFGPSAQVYGMYYYGQLASTIRINLLSPAYPFSQSVRLFKSTLAPMVEQGMSFIDPSRFAVDEELSRDIPGIPLLTLRIPFMATTYYNADFCLSLVKAEHAAFYRRVFKATALAGPEEFPGFAIPLVLFASPRENEADICARYPLFGYTETERRLMFAKGDGDILPLNILPTARLAAKAA
ncbi:N-acyl amino acid synthase FeeM domain-containing protein [Oricola sp.]|uniref:N-acyl amino acid synthase FeeM domain-containing protein n=1 Tax=Oricola sp. TaxID=1979950 RepID=UPI003BA87E47